MYKTSEANVIKQNGYNLWPGLPPADSNYPAWNFTPLFNISTIYLLDLFNFQCMTWRFRCLSLPGVAREGSPTLELWSTVLLGWNRPRPLQQSATAFLRPVKVIIFASIKSKKMQSAHLLRSQKTETNKFLLLLHEFLLRGGKKCTYNMKVKHNFIQ